MSNLPNQARVLYDPEARTMVIARKSDKITIRNVSLTQARKLAARFDTVVAKDGVRADPFNLSR